MILGSLSLFQKRGIFYKEAMVYSDQSFTERQKKELTPDLKTKFKPNDLPEQLKITPVDESGNTDYITVIFEDQGKASYPYEVTIWALIEEVPEPIIK